MTEQTGGEILVESLIAHGVDTVFGLPGAQLDPIFAALHDRQDRIRLIHSRHEQGCAYMAYGYAEVSGRIGTVLVVPGPGLLNAAAAIVTGYACNTPMLCLVGQGRSYLLGKGYGILHEIPDQFATAKGLVKWASQVTATADIADDTARAITEIWNGRTRPVYLEIPFDLAGAAAESVSIAVANQTRVTPEIDVDAINTAADILSGATCPLIVAGGGAIDAGEEILALAEKLGAPVAMTQNGLGTIDGRHPLAFTQVGAHHWWKRADVVLAIGTRLFPAAMQWGRDDDLRIIKIDIDAQELQRLPAPIDGIHGDAAEATAMLVDSVAGSTVDRSGDIETVRAEVASELEMVAPQRELLQVIRDVLGEDGVLVADLTQLYFAAQDVYPVYRPRTYVQPNYQGTLGHAAASCIGAQVAAGSRPVIGLAGDGGFMFTVQELATAVQYDVPVTFLVMNDNAFGNVKRILHENYDNRVIAADLGNPDFAKLAENFGMPGRKATTPGELRTALEQSIAAPGPALVEYAAPEFPSPWPLHFRKKVRG